MGSIQFLEEMIEEKIKNARIFLNTENWIKKREKSRRFSLLTLRQPWLANVGLELLIN